MTVVSIRGTHGSGKSTIVKKILDKYPHTPLVGEKRKPDGYLVRLPDGNDNLFVVGPYHTACGGCDAIQPYDDILHHMKWAVEEGHHVILEGALVSSSYGRVGELMNGLDDPVFAFLDTPLAACLERIDLRRTTKWVAQGKPGAPPPLDPKNTVVKFDNVARTKDQMKRLGSRIRVVDIDHRRPVTQVLKLFGVSLRREP